MIKATLIVGTGETNIQLYNLLCLLTSFSLGAYFYTVLHKRWKKILVLIFCAANGAYYVFNNVVEDGQAVFDSLAYVILSSTLVILIFMFMHEVMSNVKEEPLSMNFDFWFVASQLLYFMGGFVIFLTYGSMTWKVLSKDALSDYTNVLTWVWGVHNVLLFLSALITLGSIAWISYRRKLR